MNAKSYLPLTTAALFAAAVSLTLVANQSPTVVETAAPAAPAAIHIVDLPTVTVRPDPQDLAWYQAHRIVDLETVTVRPDPADRAAYLASRMRIVDLPVVSVRPAPEDLALYAATVDDSVQQLATR